MIMESSTVYHIYSVQENPNSKVSVQAKQPAACFDQPDSQTLTTTGAYIFLSAHQNIAAVTL